MIRDKDKITPRITLTGTSTSSPSFLSPLLPSELLRESEDLLMLSWSDLLDADPSSSRSLGGRGSGPNIGSSVSDSWIILVGCWSSQRASGIRDSDLGEVVMKHLEFEY